MKLQAIVLLSLVALHAHAAEEHAGHTRAAHEVESTTTAAAANDNDTSSAAERDHSSAAAETTTTHVHAIEPAAETNSAEAASHVHGSETPPSAHVHENTPVASATAAQPAADHIHETVAAPAEQPAAHVHETPPAITADPTAHIHTAATDSSVSAPLPVDESAAMQEARHMNMMMHGDTINTYLVAERFEQVRDDERDSLQWEMQGWVGRDINKFWFKTEGAYDTDSNNSDDVEVQALYSRAVAPYWDVQTGVRVDNGFGPSRTYAVLGLQGLAPYWFELDAAAFFSERGDLSTRLEAEYDLRFTQRLLLQPRLEVNYAFADDDVIAAGKGLRDASFGLRLRYEIRREFAPYIGVEWHKAYGDTAMYLGQQGVAPDDVNLVAGVRIWY